MREIVVLLALLISLLSYPAASADEIMGDASRCKESQVGPSQRPPVPGASASGPTNGAVCQGTIITSPTDGPPASGGGTPGPAGSGSTSSQQSTSSGARPAPVVKYIPYDRVTTGPDGQPCVTTGYYAEGTQPNDAAGVDTVTHNVRDIHNLPPLEYPPCPRQPQAPGQPVLNEPAETPSMIARRYWEEVPLPHPQPRIAPGRAITGKLAYLETRGFTSRTYTNDTIVGPLRIDATGSYTVAWGDGATSGPFSFEGEPWPGGAITHEYIAVGFYDVVVTQHWTARWSLGGQSGVLRTLQTSGSITDFPVQQIQAVIRR